MIQQAWDGFRLSHQQERVLGLIRSGFANRTIASIRIAGNIDRDLLRHALLDVIKAHEALHMTYRQVLGENSTLLMVIDAPTDPVIADMAGSEADIAAYVLAERQLDRDVSDAQPLHAALFSHGDQDQTLVLSVMRMSMDTVSVEVLVGDLQQAYAARLAGQPWLRGDIVHYADFAQWQSEQDAPSERQKELVAERAAQLAELAPLHLPLELNSTDTSWEALCWRVPTELVRQLRRHAQGQQVGLRSLLLAGWFAALWHASGRPERMAVDAMLVRRPFEELVDSIGAFEVPMPVFSTISETTLLVDLVRGVDQELDVLEQTDESSLAMAQHDARRIPSFNFLDHRRLADDSALRVTGIWTDYTSETGKIGLAAEAYGDMLTLTLRHQSLGMAKGGAEALLTCLQATLTALGEDIEQPVSALAMLDHGAGLVVIAQNNPSELPQTRTEFWHQAVERVAQREPQAIALRYEMRSWTYRELDMAANRLANELVERGVSVGTLVGLHLERSDLAIIAMLAVAKSGCAYVPLDPTLPSKRQSQILDEARLRHVLTAMGTVADLPADLDIVAVDAEMLVCAAGGCSAPRVEIAEDSPAYVLFTSGSTGVPKGVVVSHGQLAAYIDGILDRLQLAGAINAVALGSLSTDLGNTALFPSLTSGGELLVISPDVTADAQALAVQLSDASYDLMKITPSHLASVFAVADAPEQILPRRRLVLGGEPFSWGWFNLFLGFAGDCKIFNHYGPTETTVGVLCGPTTSNTLSELASTVPLGKPMRNARAYILDPQQRPLPYGVPGELWIGGSSVANGYLSQRKDQTERFFSDPFSQAPGARMYRSGDRVRYLPDGSIEFLGRIDRQVKVRGFRVELGEIEAVMRQHSRVAASLAIEAGESSARHIVGYLIDSEGSRGVAEWMRAFMSEHLPDFMVPTHFVALDRFPLTSAGKVDASMLPEPGVFGDGGKPYLEPSTDTEVRVASIVADLLLLKRVGADDDFFDIGGHSLLATQLIVQLRKAFQIELKLRSLFERPVVSELAELIDERLAAKVGQS
ncbi:non-ribosomal peptide synthetase [Aeromonas piscicola]